MKLLFLLFLLIFSANAKASLNFTYSETPEYSKPKLIDILEVQGELEQRGYWPADLSHEQKLQGIGVDQIFFDATTNKLVLLKFGQKVSDPNVIGQLIRIDHDYLFHGVNSDKVPYALYFINHRETEVRSALQGFGVKTKVSLLNFLIPEAQATCSATALATVGVLGASVASPIVLQRILNCGLTAATAAGQSVKGFAQGVRNFLNDPGSFWASTKKGSQDLIRFVSQIRVEVSKLVSAIGGLDFETAMQIGCTIAGQLLPGVIAGLVTGAGAVLLARKLATLAVQSQKIRAMGPLLQTLSNQRRAGRLRNGDRIVGQAVSCAIN